MKAITAYRPNPIQNALNDFDRYFESFFGDSILNPGVRLTSQLPAVDIRETENAYVLEMELPGYDEKNIEVHVNGNSLSINSKADENREAKKDDGTYILRERRLTSFSRSFKLPENANPESVAADFTNGILCMEIKKRPEAQKRVIQIGKK
jgi:HSP20 family protein